MTPRRSENKRDDTKVTKGGKQMLPTTLWWNPSASYVKSYWYRRSTREINEAGSSMDIDGTSWHIPQNANQRNIK